MLCQFVKENRNHSKYYGKTKFNTEAKRLTNSMEEQGEQR